MFILRASVQGALKIKNKDKERSFMMDKKTRKS
jgi:hypothetical protein